MYTLELIASMLEAAKDQDTTTADRLYTAAEQLLMARDEHARLLSILDDLRQFAYNGEFE